MTILTDNSNTKNKVLCLTYIAPAASIKSYTQFYQLEAPNFFLTKK